MKPLSDCHLYAFVDTAFLHSLAAGEIARRLCAGGADLIQLRAKRSTPDEVRQMAEEILPITARAGIPLVINDHPTIARQIGAFACHLGQEDFFERGFTRATQVTGAPSEIKLGLSTHSPEQARRALFADPDYIAIGPAYATCTKPTPAPVTLDYVRWAAANVTVPWFAIGGVHLENLDDILAA